MYDSFPGGGSQAACRHCAISSNTNSLATQGYSRCLSPTSTSRYVVYHVRQVYSLPYLYAQVSAGGESSLIFCLLML